MQHWSIDGPRSALRAVRYLVEAGRGGPESYHKWWRTACRLGLADWGVAEHTQLTRFLQLAGTYDQVDLSSLAVIEAIARRIGLTYYHYREKPR